MLSDLKKRYLVLGTPMKRIEALLGKPDYLGVGRGAERETVDVYKLFRVGKHGEHDPERRPELRLYFGPTGRLVKIEKGTWTPKGDQ